MILVLLLAAPVLDGPVIRLMDGGKLVGHSAAVTSVAAFPDGARLVSGSADGQVRVWDLRTLRATRSIAVSPHRVMAVAVSPDGDTIAVATPECAHLYDAGSGFRRTFLRPGRERGAVALAYSGDGRTVAVAHDGDEVVLYEVLTGAVRDRRPGRVPDAGPRPIAPLDAEAAWAALDGRDGVAAYRALWSLARTGSGVRLMVREMKDVAAEARKRRERIAKLIDDLDAEAFADREAATAELTRLGPDVYDDLDRALKAVAQPEPKRRLERLLGRITRPADPMPLGLLRHLRAVEALEAAGTAEARAVIERLATADDERLRASAATSLRRMKR